MFNQANIKALNLPIVNDVTESRERDAINYITSNRGVPINIIGRRDPLRQEGNTDISIPTIMNNVLLMSYKFNIHENNTDK